jgi:hypothetical protein
MSQSLRDLESKRNITFAAYQAALAAHEAALATIAADQENYDVAKKAYENAVQNSSNADAIRVTEAAFFTAQTVLEQAKLRSF